MKQENVMYPMLNNIQQQVLDSSFMLFCAQKRNIPFDLRGLLNQFIGLFDPDDQEYQKKPNGELLDGTYFKARLGEGSVELVVIMNVLKGRNELNIVLRYLSSGNYGDKAILREEKHTIGAS